jgi:hypothetical protein
MKTVEEVRRERLVMLRKEFGGQWPALNEKLGLTVRDSTLSQIANSAKNSRTGKGKEMGSPLARKIETKLGKPRGWMDTDPDVTGASPEVAPLVAALEALDSATRTLVVNLCWNVLDLAKAGDEPPADPTAEPVRRTG